MFSGHSNARIGGPSRLRLSALRYPDPSWMTLMSRCLASMSKNCRPIRALNRGRKISRRTPCSKQDLHQNRTSQGLSTALESILHRPGEGPVQLTEFWRHVGWGPSLRWFQNWQAGQGYLEHFQAFGASCYDGSSTRRYSCKFSRGNTPPLPPFDGPPFPFELPAYADWL